jgi:glycosyltransferase involved in cell wall biosynthesis
MEVAAARLGVPRHKLYLGLSPVDDRFWYPRPVPTENLICAVGSEQRDYPTLIRAVEGLELEVELAVGTVVLSSAAAATGEVAAQMRRISGQGLPGNVRLSRLSPRELRDLYARSLFVVIPLKDVDYDAGVTAVVEAMAMGKAVIVSRTRGQVDVIRDGEQGIYVPPGDSVALRAAIEYLASHPAEAERMGRAGRRLVEERHTLDLYVARLAALVRGLATEDTVIPRPMPSEG